MATTSSSLSTEHIGDLTIKAAHGSLEAQRAMREQLVAAIITCPHPDASRTPAILIIEALIFARMAFAHGRNDDLWRLVDLLNAAARIFGESGMMTIGAIYLQEAHALLVGLASTGDPAIADEADAMLVACPVADITRARNASRGIH